MEGDDIWGDSSGGGEESKTEESKTEDASAAAEPDLEDDETKNMSNGELRQRIHLLGNDIRVMKSDVQRITHESRGQRDRIRENQDKVKLNKQLPYLVANVVEILEPDAEDGEILFVWFRFVSFRFVCDSRCGEDEECSWKPTKGVEKESSMSCNLCSF